MRDGDLPHCMQCVAPGRQQVRHAAVASIDVGLTCACDLPPPIRTCPPWLHLLSTAGGRSCSGAAPSRGRGTSEQAQPALSLPRCCLPGRPAAPARSSRLPLRLFRLAQSLDFDVQVASREGCRTYPNAFEDLTSPCLSRFTSPAPGFRRSGSRPRTTWPRRARVLLQVSRTCEEIDTYRMLKAL